MTQISPKLFKKYDIRGQADGDDAPLTTDAARLIGLAFGTYLDRVEGLQKVIVGRDNRRSSPALAAALIEGLQASGCAVTDIRLTSTPIVYWHAVRAGKIGGVMVTGSHLKPDQNGFKLCVGARNIYGDGIQAIRQLIEDDDFNGGYEMVSVNESALVDYIVGVVPRLRMIRALHVVVDGGNGTGGAFGPRLLKAWGHRVTELFCELDGTYPNHQPDPQEPENMRALAEKVREAGADVGIAFDGDADRMGVVDEQGNIISADRVLALLAGDMLRRHAGAKVVADVLSSQVLFDEVARVGGMPIMWASGHSLVKAKMAEVGALIGGEMSGHIFLAEDYYGFDDAYVAAARLLQLVGAAQVPLSVLNAQLPTLYSTPEYRPRCPDDLKDTVVAAVKAALEGRGEVTSIDGIRVRFEHGWGLLRPSNTEPVLSMRFEGETEADALAYRDLFFAELRNFPQIELPE
ncbi:MAG: phosphomannomutase/phosphoglucomutase [Anaerolineae bacterium]|nr:phosphomannomutase/phosphoglucomutase [Anaerolineae bacterium]